jgi:hypothetical protein
VFGLLTSNEFGKHDRIDHSVMEVFPEAKDWKTMDAFTSIACFIFAVDMSFAGSVWSEQW